MQASLSRKIESRNLDKNAFTAEKSSIEQELRVQNKTLPLVMFISAFLMSMVTGLRIINMAKANPIEIEYTTPPIISLHSPIDNDTFSVNTVLLNLTVTKPDNWLIHGGYAAQQHLWGINYQLDGNFSDTVIVNSDLSSPLDYSVNLTNLTDGVHSLKVYAYASGWVIQISSLTEYAVPINSSSNTVYFTVDTTSPMITILSLENQTYYTSNVPLNFTVNEVNSQISYSLDGLDNVTISGNTTLTELPNGDHNVTVYATDQFGNTGASETICFTIIALFPTLLVVASVIIVAVIGAGLLFYFKKRRR
jgi:hypothetical protein